MVRRDKIRTMTLGGEWKTIKKYCVVLRKRDLYGAACGIRRAKRDRSKVTEWSYA